MVSRKLSKSIFRSIVWHDISQSQSLTNTFIVKIHTKPFLFTDVQNETCKHVYTVRNKHCEGRGVYADNYSNFNSHQHVTSHSVDIKTDLFMVLSCNSISLTINYIITFITTVNVFHDCLFNSTAFKTHTHKFICAREENHLIALLNNSDDDDDGTDDITPERLKHTLTYWQ